MAFALAGDLGTATVDATLEFLANQATDPGARRLRVSDGVLCHKALERFSRRRLNSEDERENIPRSRFASA